MLQRRILCLPCLHYLVLQACFMPLMKIGTITSTLKRSPVDSLPAVGGPSLKGRNVRWNAWMQRNESPKLHMINLVLQKSLFLKSKLKVQMLFWEVLKVCVASTFLSSRSSLEPLITFAYFPASLLQGVWCGPRWGSISRWTAWDGGGPAGGVEGQSHGHSPRE